MREAGSREGSRSWSACWSAGAWSRVGVIPGPPSAWNTVAFEAMLVSAAPRLLPRSTESIWFSSPALDEDAALTEMEAALEAQVAAAHVSFCAALALMLPPCAAASRDPKLQR